jgi:hypothetical protein
LGIAKSGKEKGILGDKDKGLPGNKISQPINLSIVSFVGAGLPRPYN